MQVRFFTLLVFLFGSAEVFAQQDFVNQAISFCKKHGGSYSLGAMAEKGGKYCKQVTCRKGSPSGDYTVTDEDVANGNSEGNVEATKEVCVDKSVVDGSFTDGLDGSGSISGNGTSVVIGEGDDLNIYDENGNIIGTRGSGSVSVNVGGSIGVATMSTGDMCYDKCFRRGFLNIFGKKKWRLDKKSCLKCLESTGRNVSVNGNTVNTRNGKVTHSVSLPDGVTISGNGSISGNGHGHGHGNNGSVIISGGGGVWAGGNGGSRSGGCTYIYHPDECPGGGRIIIDGGGSISGGDCVNCEGSWKKRRNDGSVWNGIANLAGAIAGPLAYYGVNAKWANAYRSGQQAWAGAASTGFEQCQLMQTNYVQSTYDYIQTNQLQDREVMPPNCNGYQLGGFSGSMGYMGNGFGGFGNPWGSAGYSPGFVSGMYGPYGMYGMGNGMNGMSMYGMYGMGNGMGNMGMNGMGMYGMGNMGMNGMGMYGMGNMGMYGMNGMGMNNGMGLNLNLGWGMGNGSSAMCFQAPCNVGNTGYGYWGSPTNYGMNPWGNGSGSYWNGSGSWGNGMNGSAGWGMNGNANFGNIQQSYSLNQQAAYQDSILAQTGMNPWSTGYGMGMGNYGYAPYSPSNLGFSMNAGFGFNF